ncbi:MAG: S9 family peptidase, partial [bacterium]|nr:S9 family peptidase [bacterium]
MKKLVLTALALSFAIVGVLQSAELDDQHFNPLDVFQLEYAADPQISPDGEQIVYVRSFMDIMTDRRRSNLWIINSDGTDHRPLTTGNENHNTPRWSPDGNRLIYVSREDDTSQIYCRWMDTGQTAKLSQLTSSPRGISWSPDGKSIAFSMLVPASSKPFASMPPKPKGAE